MKFRLYFLILLALVMGATFILIVGAGFLFPRKRPIPITTPDLEVSVLGSRIRYRVHEGGDPVIILLHGFGGSLGGWEKVTLMLSDSQCIALDLVGFGGSDRPPLSYDIEIQRQHLIAFMDVLNIQQAVLVGFSMGASIAAWTGAKSKERVAGLILIAPSAYPGSLTYPWPLSWIYRPGLANQVASVVVDNPIFRWIFPSSLAPQAIGATNSYDLNFAEALEDIHQPTLLIWSRGDKKVPFKYHLAYKERIPNLEFQKIPASVGHGVPKGTASFINKFVNKHPSFKSLRTK
ncbi:MAG: alpha/beta hydrolase, partial [Deltaproteobacteria bacterium]|nr:alpha/beta hydrolase [Deltaproteobacteria bacterium]